MGLAQEIRAMEPVDSIQMTIEKLRRVRSEIAEIKRQQERLVSLERMAQQYKSAIIKHIEQIDWKDSHNTGWEARIIQFLLDVTAPASKDEPPNA